eukprot:sb/3475169/
MKMFQTPDANKLTSPEKQLAGKQPPSSIKDRANALFGAPPPANTRPQHPPPSPANNRPHHPPPPPSLVLTEEPTPGFRPPLAPPSGAPLRPPTQKIGTYNHCTGKCPVALGGSGGTAPSIKNIPSHNKS